MTEASILKAARWGTAAFAVAAVAAAAAPDALARPVAVLDVGLFIVGCVAFLAAFFRAVGRSRTEAISVFGLYFAADAGAEPKVAATLRWATAAQLVIAIVTASIRLYTPLAFGILVPVYGLGLTGLWSAHHGRFEPRDGPT